MMRIECPECGATAVVGSMNEGAANDDESLRDWEAPEGFRKVQLGPSFDRLYLYCATCGIPARVARPGLARDVVSADARQAAEAKQPAS